MGLAEGEAIIDPDIHRYAPEMLNIDLRRHSITSNKGQQLKRAVEETQEK